MVDSILTGPPDREGPGQHLAHFYRHVEQMVQAACGYITDGLRRGEAVVIVATQVHWARMVGKLATIRGIDLVDTVASGQLRHIDAEVVLDGLLENGMPDARRFHDRAGALVERSLGRFGNVRIITELAGMLWASGNRAAALRLEELWNGLASRFPFTLLCTYRSDTLRTDGYNSALQDIYSAHASMEGCRTESGETNCSPRSSEDAP